MNYIDIKDLKLSYKILKTGNINTVVNIPKFKLDKGDIVGFFGPNHVGKSTLLRYISQIYIGLDIKSNHILYDGKKYDKSNNSPLILHIPQDYSTSLLPWFSIKKNLRIIMKSLKYTDKEIENKVKIFCDDFGFDTEDDLMKYYGFYKKDKNDYIIRTIKELSGGQKQILSVLRAMIVKPDIVTMDEPFSALDTFTKGEEFRKKVFTYLESNDITTLIVAHELEEIIAFTKKLFIFNYDANGYILKGEEDSHVLVDEIPLFAQELKEKYGLGYI